MFDVAQPKITILGIGNLFLGDEGLGIHFVRMLREDNLDYANLEIIDGDTCPEIASLIEDTYKLIIVDAIKGGKEPGTVYRLVANDMVIDSPPRVSSHELNVMDSLKALKLMGSEPKNIVIVGIEPKNIDWSLELSSKVKGKLDELKKIVIEEVKGAN